MIAPAPALRFMPPGRISPFRAEHPSKLPSNLTMGSEYDRAGRCTLPRPLLYISDWKFIPELLICGAAAVWSRDTPAVVVVLVAVGVAGGGGGTVIFLAVVVAADFCAVPPLSAAA